MGDMTCAAGRAVSVLVALEKPLLKLGINPDSFFERLLSGDAFARDISRNLAYESVSLDSWGTTNRADGDHYRCLNPRIKMTYGEMAIWLQRNQEIKLVSLQIPGIKELLVNYNVRFIDYEAGVRTAGLEKYGYAYWSAEEGNEQGVVPTSWYFSAGDVVLIHAGKQGDYGRLSWEEDDTASTLAKAVTAIDLAIAGAAGKATREDTLSALRAARRTLDE